MQYPERESNPRFRCERPASSTARRSGQEGTEGCDGWGRTSVYRLTAGRPAIERRRIIWAPRPDSNGRHVGSKPTALTTELRGDDGGGRTRTCERCDRLRASNALPFQLGHASMSRGEEGEGVEPPRPCDPPVFETGYHADGSPSEQ
jgi:hypothetical protein